ncbi:MAG: hypothetical protein EBS53_09815 [Bacteroidetes bacterium]|nr:hypothetical protein [Bacteroidota bacterium]
MSIGQRVTHNIKNGTFKIWGKTGNLNTPESPWVGVDYGGPLPSDWRHQWNLSETQTSVIGKTYSGRTSGKSLFDINGVILLKGVYTTGLPNFPEPDPWDPIPVTSEIKKGQFSFRGSKFDCSEALYGIDRDNSSIPDNVFTFNGFVRLRNKKTYQFRNANGAPNGIRSDITAFDFGSSLYGPFNIGESLWLELKLNTIGSVVSGTANLFYCRNRYETIEYRYPNGNDNSKKWEYSVRGEYKNEIAKLELTGLRSLQGLKGTIYLDGNDRSYFGDPVIIRNGKNIITIFGQNIKY